MSKKSIVIIISVITFIIIISGISYSYFVYNKDVGNFTLNTGEISINSSGINENVSLSGLIPLSDIDGKTSSDYFDFTVNSTVDSEKIYYEVYLVPKSGNTINTDYLKVYVTDQNDVMLKDVTEYNSLTNSQEQNGKIIYRDVVEINNNETKKTEAKNLRLRMWVSEDYPRQSTNNFDFDVYLYAYNVDRDYVIPYGSNLLRRAITAKETLGGTCSDITYEEDGITYLSGTNECIDMNYVWYSGKLWRITAIYPDGSMKLVTENLITSIAYNESGQINFYTDANTTSYMYQWLNEDFYDTLYNANNIIDTSKKWNATNSNESSINTKLAETTMVTANVGLLNSYEYYNSYRNLGSYSNGYLNIGYYWWLLNPYNESCIRYVDVGTVSYNTPPGARGVRPSIVIKPGLEFTGVGTSQSPYEIVGDKAQGEANELINTRMSGEYVKLKNGNNEQVFRIIGVEDSKTKIIAMDYADNEATKPFATSDGSNNTLWGSGTTTDTGTWYTYLNEQNTGYFDTLKNTYGNLFDSATYYLGISGSNYKLSVCANTTSGNTKVCDKTNDNGTFSIGLPRYGEIFATQQAGGSSNSITMWLINRYYSTIIWDVNNDSYGGTVHPTSTLGARPTVHLKSTVKILSGSGTENDPYIVGL